MFNNEVYIWFKKINILNIIIIEYNYFKDYIK